MAKIENQGNLKSGFIPLDPEASPSSKGRVSDRGMHIPDLDIIDAKNVMPTTQGYTSFFGIGDTLGTTSLTQDIQELIVYRTLYGDFIQIALCATGIWMRSLKGDGVGSTSLVGDKIKFDLDALGKASWINIITTEPLSPWKNWTYTIMNNTLYVFQKGMDYIGNIYAEQPEQIILEKLTPTYILSALEKHKYTFSSEEDSTGDDTYKSLHFTTDTGLDFGLQRIPLDSAASVSMAIESWENIFASSGLFVTEFTETARVETGVDAVIPIASTIRDEQLALIASNTTHNGSSTECTITPQYSGLLLDSDTIDSYLFQVTATNDIYTDTGNWTISGDLGDAVFVGNVYELVAQLHNYAKPAAVGDKAYAVTVTKTGHRNVVSGAYKDIYMEFVLEVYRNTRDTVFSLVCDNSDISIDVTLTRRADTRKHGGSVISIWEAEFITGVTNYDWPYSLINDPEDTGTAVAVTEAQILSMLTSHKSNLLRTSAETLAVGDSPYAISHISTIVHEFGGSKYRIKYRFTTIDYGWGIATDENALLEQITEIMPQELERISCTYNSTITYDYQAPEASAEKLASIYIGLPMYSKVTHLTTGSYICHFHDGDTDYSYNIPIGTDNRTLAANVLAWFMSLPKVTGILCTKIESQYGGTYQGRGVNIAATMLATANPATMISYEESIAYVVPVVELSRATYKQLAYADSASYYNYSAVKFDSISASGLELIVEGYTTGALTVYISTGIEVDTYVNRETARGQIALIQTLADDINTNVAAVHAAVTIEKRTGAGTNSQVHLTITWKTPNIMMPKNFVLPNISMNCVASEGNLTIMHVAGDDGIPSTDDWLDTTIVPVARASIYPKDVRGIKVTGFKKKYPSVLAYGDYSYQLALGLDSNDIVDKLRLLYLADATVSPYVGAAVVNTACECQLNYTFNVYFSLANAVIVPTATRDQDGTSVFTENTHTHTTLAMGHIEGIASGRSRLVAWDVDNNIYWSSATNLVDFTPGASTGANQVALSSLKGNITICKGYKQGFIIYGTGNIIAATFEPSATSIYSFQPIDEAPGLIDFRHLAAIEDAHYYWSHLGLYVIDPNSKNAKAIAPELTDWMLAFRYPIQLGILENRYICIYTQDRDPLFSNRAIRNGATPILSRVPHTAFTSVDFDYIAPGNSLYPEFVRVFVLDTVGNRWGSCDVPTKLLASLTPINQSGYNVTKNYEIMAAPLDNALKDLVLLDSNGDINMCNTYPTSSYVLFGHYATHRSKRTKLIGVSIECVTYPNATIEIELSENGSLVDFANTETSAQTTLHKDHWFNMSAKWFNILVKGHFNIKRLITKGYSYGR